MIAKNLSSVVKLPLVLSFSIIYCFYILGLYWLSGITVFILAIIINIFLATRLARAQKQLMKA